MTNKRKIFILLSMCLLAISVWAVYYFTIPITPNTNMYKTTRTCDFVTVGNITGAFCTDGSTWQISPLPQGQVSIP